MSDLDKFIKQINQLTEPARKISRQMDKIIPPYVQKLNQAFAPLRHQANVLSQLHSPLFEQVHSLVQKTAAAAKEWQTARKADVTVMAENGWYPNWFTFFYQPEEEPNSLDELMVMHLEDKWADLTVKIIELCPNREHVLKTAFKLHEEGNYIAAIPLFFSQADGICCEVLKSFLFTGNDTNEKLDTLIENGELEVNMLLDVFLEPFKLKNHHNAGISKASVAHKKKAPNRNGILHGHRKHLDYGTKINSLKCFSLLAFTVYTVKEMVSGK
ncbi:hypothetical protein I6E72_16185 [Pseudoalteromonas sp. NSLLW24]|uniref:hypothetical protein n=1 Tax=Pseudoalteromonas sp. NSLLW24 TaxID=2792050 RepID=UPI0018CD6751|nr:hypothetical protein [Pseudoalteromonas sp. NSLLW24]MBH0000495.1 hypothetical protein [Pseudoalteromonas sp. NSLLW24]